MNKDELEAIVTNMTEVSLDIGFANQLLISSLVKYLADKKIIDLDDYLQHNQETQEHLLKVLNDETEKNLVEKLFQKHRNDFQKPE